MQGLQGTNITTLNLRNNELHKWEKPRITAFVEGLQGTQITTLHLSEMDVNHFYQMQNQSDAHRYLWNLFTSHQRRLSIEFFNKNFPNKHLIGIECHKSQYEYCSKIFENNNNIKIIQSDFTTTNLLQYDPDCFFLGAPFNKDSDFIKFLIFCFVFDFSIGKDGRGPWVAG